jgi:hypothetical protein
MKDIVINTKGVFKLLKDLNPHKATGPDCIPSFILKRAVCCYQLGFTGTLASEPMLFISQDVVPVKVTHNVDVDYVFN